MATAITTLPSPLLGSSWVQERLFERGVELEPLPGEAPASHGDRLDTALMALFRDTGSEEAFEALYRHARQRVQEWLCSLARRVPRRLDPADLVQDTFVNVYRYPASFRDERATSFRSWVRTIGANALRRALEGSLERGARMQEGLREPVDSARGPHGSAAELEELGHLAQAWSLFLGHYAAAFERLSERDRRALHLVEIEGCSYAEAGAALGVGPSNMKMIMLRARRRLHRHMWSAMAPAAA
jgi:RNA polymerase sigma-70 factor (ECF subfamily)